MALQTETIPLEVTGFKSGDIAKRISTDIDEQRKRGRKFLGGIPVDWLMFDTGEGLTPMKFIFMVYEGEE